MATNHEAVVDGAATRGNVVLLDAEDERYPVVYATPAGQIKLNTAVVRRFFCPEATDLEASAFMGFCKHSGLNPFLREVYLTKMGSDEEGGGGSKAQIIVAYTSFMKRAEEQTEYKGFRAGLVVMPRAGDEGASAQPVKGEPDIVSEPMFAIRGEIRPPGYDIVGAWCKVFRSDRSEEPTIVTVDLEEYIQYKRDGKTPRKNWKEKRATMIVKTAIGHGHRDAFPSALAGFHLEEEMPTGDRVMPATPIPAEDVAAAEPKALPPALTPLFDQLGMRPAERAMWLGRHRDKAEDEQVTLLRQEITALAPAPAATPAPPSASVPPPPTSAVPSQPSLVEF